MFYTWRRDTFWHLNNYADCISNAHAHRHTNGHANTFPIPVILSHIIFNLHKLWYVAGPSRIPTSLHFQTLDNFFVPRIVLRLLGIPFCVFGSRADANALTTKYAPTVCHHYQNVVIYAARRGS